MAFTVMGVEWRSLVLMITLLLLVPHVALALVSEGDVLLRFKSEVIDRQAKLVNWNISNDPCLIPGDGGNTTWFGVTCSDNVTVSGLDLSFFSLRGSISKVLADLGNLAVLDLSDNSFDGQIPESLFELNLTYLDLSNNQLTGPIPKLPHSLRYLYLDSNSLQGDIPVDNLLNLQLRDLDLHGNNLTGKLPDKLWNYDGLRFLYYLDLSRNQIEGSLPSDLGSVGVTYIDLSHNKFVGGMPQNRWGFLYYLDLSGNNLNGSIPSQLFTTFVDPIYLNLSDNGLSGLVSFQSSTLTRIQF